MENGQKSYRKIALASAPTETHKAEVQIVRLYPTILNARSAMYNNFYIYLHFTQ
jgi:hypothetical protein